MVCDTVLCIWIYCIVDILENAISRKYVLSRAIHTNAHPSVGMLAVGSGLADCRCNSDVCLNLKSRVGAPRLRIIGIIDDYKF